MIADLDDLYQDVIVDHGKSPRNFRAIDDATHHAEGFNPLCGDRIHVYLILNSDNEIQDIAFQGNACAICTASASLMSERLKSASSSDAKQIFEAVRHMLMKDVDSDSELVGKLAVLAGVRKYPMRVKCATLPWHSMMEALRGNADEPITTE